MTIRFRDRPLKKGEKSTYYCDKCGTDVHPDLRDHHKCIDRILTPPFDR